MSSNIESVIQSATRVGYGQAVSDLYALLKARKGSDNLSWEDMDLVTAMMKKEADTFMPKDGLYDQLGSTLKEIQR